MAPRVTAASEARVPRPVEGAAIMTGTMPVVCHEDGSARVLDAMRLVLDTNMLVSALLKAGSVPDRALGAIWTTRALVLYDARIVDEYRRVLGRPKFRAIAPPRIDDLFARLLAHGRELADVPVWEGAMSDADDRIFVEVALAGRADAIVTGNLRDFPRDLGFEVHPPATLLAMLE